MNRSTKLGRLLQERRLALGLSQKEVATAFGYSTSQVVSDWERGISSPPGYVLCGMTKYFGVSLETFYEIILEERTEILARKIRRSLGLKGS